MRKYLLFAALSFVNVYQLCAQHSPAKITDSLTVDSLKKILPSLQDTARINCLNALCEAYEYYTPPDGTKEITKNISLYATQANNESVKLEFKKGQASSLIHLAWLERTNKNFSAAENYIQRAKLLAEQIQDGRILGWVYYYLADIPNDKMKYDEKLNNYKAAQKYFQKSGDEDLEAEVSAWLCANYNAVGNYEVAIDYCQRSYLLAQKRKAKMKWWGNWMAQFSLTNMVELHRTAGDYENAISYLRKGNRFADENQFYWNMNEEMGDLFFRSGQYDSSLFYMKKSLVNADTSKMWVKFLKGKVLILEKDYENALKIFNQCIVLTRKTNYIGMWSNLHFAARSLEGMKKYKEAVQFEQKAVTIAHARGVWQWRMDSYDLLSNLFHHLGRSDSAYIYLKKYAALKDSMHNRQFQWKLNNLKAQAEGERKELQIALLNKDNKIKSQQLKQDNQLKKFLLFSFLGLLFIGFFVFRTMMFKRKNEVLANARKQSELQQRVLELEMQALRAQMNPHFIFNCLNSINRFIFKNETKEASDYLTRFSRLIRMVLLHSQKKLVALEDELDMLKLYLDMERLRFKNAFDYHITTTNSLETAPIFIPPLLLQPFCENAIWHGLMHKDGPGHLNIEINEINRVLYCTITDDGVGRERAEEFNSKSAEKEKSMGLKITKERLSLNNQGTTGGTFYEIEDLRNEEGEAAGTRVRLQILYKETVEEFDS
jgi:tetratricopeptide (TPR) repeat protein